MNDLKFLVKEKVNHTFREPEIEQPVIHVNWKSRLHRQPTAESEGDDGTV